MESIVMVLAAAAAVGIYRLGLRDGSRLGRGEPLGAPVGQAESRWQRVLRNIEAYNGTPKGQQGVEE